MRDLDFTSVDDSDVAILIGADFPQLHLYRDIKTMSSNSFQSFTSPPLDQIVENFWEIEPYRTKHKETSSAF